MINPDNIISIEYDTTPKEIIKINKGDLPPYDKEDYDLLDPKDFKKYLKDIEKECRTSFEYKAMVKYMRENMDMNRCAVYENVNNIDTAKIKIHLHHHPFTLWDISQIVFKKRCAMNESLKVSMVAKEVMFLHYKLMVGLIPLSETVHELVHNMYLFIPIDKVLGNVQQFINMYEPYFEPEQHDSLERIYEFTRTYNEEVAAHKDLLSKHYIYLDTTGAYNMPRLQDIIERINEISKENSQQNYQKRELITPIEKLNN